MARINLRRFSWTIKSGADGLPVVDKIKSVANPAQLLVDMSDLILTNALATTVSRPVLYDATAHELRLLGSYLYQAPNEQLRLRDDPFRASALHIRRFVTESVGLGMLTASVQAAYRWYSRGGVHNLDALPTALAARYRGKGARPDFLYDVPTMLLAGEARGRSHNPPASPARAQYERLNQLLPWANRHDHGLVMTWAYLTGTGITVDWFAEEDKLPDLARQVGVPMPADDLDVLSDEARVPARVPYSDDAPASFHGSPDTVREHPTDDQPRAHRERRFDETDPSDLLAEARNRVSQIEQQLFTTAPATQAPIRIDGRALRGQWVPLDLVGAPVGSLLFGLLDRPLSQRASWEVTENLRRLVRQRTDTRITDVQTGQLPPDPPVTVSVRGRLLVAVADPEFTEPWDLLAD
jgi:hypothetical protein